MSKADIPKDLIPDNTILLAYRGSIAHATYIPDHIDDKDIMGVCFGPVNMYLGLNKFEQLEKKIDPWDSVVYEIKKMFSLLIKQNPNVLSILWCQKHHYIKVDEYGKRILDARELFLSKKAYHSFSGYAWGQLKRMEHFPDTGKGYMGAKRKKLVEEHGYDCKNAAHLVRLLRMGIEYLTEGQLNVHRNDAKELIEIKTGGWTLEKVKREAEALFKLSREAFVRSKLPDQPDLPQIETLLQELIYDYLINNYYDGMSSQIKKDSAVGQLLDMT